MLRLAASWVWDSWLVDDGDRFHLFFLKAPRAPGEPQRRHWRAAIGHAVSDDLTHWTELSDALGATDGPAFDDLATWTGSVVRDPAGLWRLFYTGVDRAGDGAVQRIGQATSYDLTTWERTDLLLEADPRWYERLDDGSGWPDQAWRDPWVMPDGGGGWRILVTARAREGDLLHRGVIGQATSPDLVHWEVGPPLSTPDAGFGQLEVLQYAVVDGQPLLLFSCLHTEMDTGMRTGSGGGVWSVPVGEGLADVDVTRARRVTSEALYSGRVIRDRSGSWVMLAFRHLDEHGSFVGEITDPIPVVWQGDRLRMRYVPDAWRPDPTRT